MLPSLSPGKLNGVYMRNIQPRSIQKHHDRTEQSCQMITHLGVFQVPAQDSLSPSQSHSSLVIVLRARLLISQDDPSPVSSPYDHLAV